MSHSAFDLLGQLQSTAEAAIALSTSKQALAAKRRSARHVSGNPATGLEAWLGQILLELGNAPKGVSSTQLGKHIGLSRAWMFQLLREARNRGLVRTEGAGRGAKWFLAISTCSNKGE